MDRSFLDGDTGFGGGTDRRWDLENDIVGDLGEGGWSLACDSHRLSMIDVLRWGFLAAVGIGVGSCDLAR